MKNNKILVIICLSVMMVLTCITACQPTPAEDIVIQKDIEAIIEEQILVNPKPENSAAIEPIAPYNAPEYWEEELKLPYLTFHIQADIIVPDMLYYPVLSVKQWSLTPEEALEKIESLLNDANAFSIDARVKSDLELELMYVKRGKWNPDTERYESYPGQEAEISALKKMIMEAPEETITYDIADFSLESLPARFHLLYEDGKDIEVAITSHSLLISSGGNTILQPESWLHKDNDITGELGIEALENIKISKEDALIEANAAIQQYGLNDLELISAEHGRLFNASTKTNTSEGWILNFGRSDYGYKPFDLAVCSDAVGHDDIEYFAPLATEKLRIYVDEYGVRIFSWTDPWNVAKEPYARNVDLLSFEDIQNRIRQQLTFEWSWVDEVNPFFSLDQDLYDLTLTYCLIPQKNNPEAALLIPAWIGRYKMSIEADNDALLYSMVAISAIDGSRVTPLQYWGSE